MSTAGFSLARPEGGLHLFQDSTGAVRMSGPPTRNFESLLVGRRPQDAIFLSQQISADSGISHALCAAMAWEAAAGISVAQNGALVRELLHTLSFLHAHLRHFYFQALPDFVPQNAFADYEGPLPELRAAAAALAGKPEQSWARATFRHAFSKPQVARLAENQARSVRALSILQRMMALLGGKFPMVMSIVPGGISVPVTEPLVFRLRDYLTEITPFLRTAPFEDGALVTETLAPLKTLGRGKDALICVGTMGEDEGPGASLSPKGVLVAGTLEPLLPHVTENIHSAFYRISLRGRGGFRPLENAPQKPGAHSWIKAPRYQERAMETGPLSRLLITHLAGSRSHTGAVAERIQKVLGAPLAQANTAAGRLLAGLGELTALQERCVTLLDQLTPGRPPVGEMNGNGQGQGEGAAWIEAPAGALQHRMALEGGRISYYDIIAPSTWNGTPQDESGETGGMEVALNHGAVNLATREGQLAASRIVHSYLFSGSDAVH